MDITEILTNEKKLQELTTLKFDEFHCLLTAFEKVWKEQNQMCTFEGTKRRRAPGGGNKGILATIEAKLMFILAYFKHYPTQTKMAIIWGMSQPQVNEWIHRLTFILHAALKSELKLPESSISNLPEALRQSKNQDFIIDGVERERRRPKDEKKQKDCYSGKKKKHTNKNVILTSNRKVIYLSKTAGGRWHDEKVAAPLRDCPFPKNSTVLKDSGLQGVRPKETKSLSPFKKPPGRELCSIKKRINRAISSLRVEVEHVISGIKRCRIVSYVFRNIKENFENIVMEVACAIHNLRTDFRTASS
jgi:hypothetical protein